VDKPGYATTEFWKALIPQALALLLVLHVVAAKDAATLQDSLLRCVEAVSALLTSGAVVFKYVEGRVRLKEAAAGQARLAAAFQAPRIAPDTRPGA
jgi:hypothetical protein